MALQPHTVECIFGTVLVMALMTIAATTWAVPLSSIFGAGSGSGFFNLPLIF